MVDAWKLVEDALSDSGRAAPDPRLSKRLRMYTLNVILALDGMRRQQDGSPGWRGFLRIYSQSLAAIEGALGREQAERVAGRIVKAMRGRRITLPRR